MSGIKTFIANKTVDITAVTLLIASHYTDSAFLDDAFHFVLGALFLLSGLAFGLYFVMVTHPKTRDRPMRLSTGPRGWSDFAFDLVFSLLLVVYVHFLIGLAWYASTLLLKTLVKRHNARTNATLQD